MNSKLLRKLNGVLLISGTTIVEGITRFGSTCHGHYHKEDLDLLKETKAIRNAGIGMLVSNYHLYEKSVKEIQDCDSRKIKLAFYTNRN
jgi:hypothetical protein